MTDCNCGHDLTDHSNKGYCTVVGCTCRNYVRQRAPRRLLERDEMRGRQDALPMPNPEWLDEERAKLEAVKDKILETAPAVRKLRSGREVQLQAKSPIVLHCTCCGAPYLSDQGWRCCGPPAGVLSEKWLARFCKECAGNEGGIKAKSRCPKHCTCAPPAKSPGERFVETLHKVGEEQAPELIKRALTKIVGKHSIAPLTRAERKELYDDPDRTSGPYTETGDEEPDADNT